MKLSAKLVSSVILCALISGSSTYAQEKRDNDDDCPGAGCPGKEEPNDGDFSAGFIFGAAIGSILKESGSKANNVGKPSGSPQVRSIQMALNAAGFNAGSVDGINGPKTRRAISEFQKKQGDEETGVLTQRQLGLLLSNFFAEIDQSQVPLESRRSSNDGGAPQRVEDEFELTCRRNGDQFLCSSDGSISVILNVDDGNL